MGSRPEVWVVAGARTPMAEYESSRTGAGAPGGALASVSAPRLAAVAAQATLERAGTPPEAVDHVVMGNAVQSGPDGIYGARHAALHAAIPVEVPALTVNRLCGSGIQSIICGAQWIALGEADRVLAGGMENMSQCPHLIRGARTGFKLGQGQLVDALTEALLDDYCGLQMAETAERLASRAAISRQDQDAFALRSQQEAHRAQAAGLFAEEIVPVSVGRGSSQRSIEVDDHLRPATTLEGLAALKPVFARDGCVTAGNASGIVDGAATVLLSRDSAGALGAIRGWAVVGVEPEVMGIGPVPAIQKLLADTGMTLDSIDLFEINEAFAAQYLAVERALELDRAKVNVNGGAIALGHPLGATGTRLVLTLLCALKRRRCRFGVAAACIGGGQGIAMLVESAGPHVNGQG